MKYKELKEPCKSEIELGKCLGCSKLELIDFESDKNCKYIQKEEQIEQIKLSLNIYEEPTITKLINKKGEHK